MKLSNFNFQWTKTLYMRIIVDTTVAPAVYIVGQQYFARCVALFIMKIPIHIPYNA